jgi:predicted O-methyltransferase YrrM
VVVEIGCYEGKTTAALGSNTSGTVYSIDPFFKGRFGICYGEFIARSHCRRKGLSNIQFVKALSHEAAADFSSEIDFLFLDADHSFDATKRDWEDWFPKVRDGGIIALHDCRQAPNSPDYLGSMKFYEEYLAHAPHVKEIDGVDSLVVLKVVR